MFENRMGNYKELNVWQESMMLIEKVYKLCEKEPLCNDFGLRNQMQRSAVSVASNIAEGEERGSIKDSIRFIHIAKGSVSELVTQILIANRIGYIDDKVTYELENSAEKINASLKNLIKYRRTKL